MKSVQRLDLGVSGGPVLQRSIFVFLAAALASACSHDCKSARDCDADERCVSFKCKGAGESLGVVGDSCTATSQCGNGLTCETAGFPNGFCTLSCAEGSGSTCPSGACAGLAAGDLCAATCTVDAQCRN